MSKFSHTTPAPRVTVILTTYNRALFLDAVIESVRVQTFTDWEIVITDDGSTDGTVRAVAAWMEKEPRIRYVRSEVNQGLSKNYNQGFALARGEYIAIIDDDDPWCDQEKLAKQVAFLDARHDYVACGGGVVVVNQDGKELYRYLKPETDAAIRERMLFSNPMANSTTVFRRSAAERVGWYDGSIFSSSDRDFFLKLGLVGKLYNFPEHYIFYTMTGSNTTIAKLRPHLKVSLMVMRRYKGNYPHYPLALAVNYTQYLYAFLPAWVRRLIHTTLARIKHATAG